MSQPEITVLPGIISWFGEHRPAELGASCGHVCDHGSKEVIAWGPTDDKYEMVRCRLCECRGWRKYRESTDFRMVA